MPFPLDINWFHAERNASHFVLGNSNHTLAPRLIDCHQEIIDRAGPSTLETLAGMGPAGYLLKRSTWIQERLINLYVTAIRGGISKQGYFYGVFQEHNLLHEMDAVRLDTEVVSLTDGPTHVVYRIGLLYTPELMDNTPLNNAIIESNNLPTQVLPKHVKRDIYDQTEPPRRSRYDRPPVI